MKENVKKELIDWLKTIVGAVVIVLLIQHFLFIPVRVEGRSMEPTFSHNDRLIVWELGYKPESGDIVVFDPPIGLGGDKHWIKRIIATEGQTVRIDYDTNSVYVNDNKIEETYLGEEMDGSGMIEEVVPKDCVFVLGDNRNHSSDSRVIGAVKSNSIIGKVVARIWPLPGLE